MSKTQGSCSNNEQSRNRHREVAVMLRAALWLGILLCLPLSLLAQDDIRPLKTHSQRLDQKGIAALQSQPMPQDYIISQDDDLDIYVLDVPELTRAYRVSPTGTIDVPLLAKPITAAGLTPEQLSQVIADQLQTAGMVQQPHVTVRVKESRLHSVAIAGAVKKPQIYPIFGKTTLLDALSQAEGLADDAGNTAIITRGDTGARLAGPEPGQEVKGASPLPNPRSIRVDLKRLLEDGDITLNFDLYAGDRVTVQRAGIVYVVGAVNRAGGFVLKDDRQQMTVLKALALAQYLKSTANEKKTVIIRETPGATGGAQEIPVALDKIVAHKEKDRVLLANDILLIPDSSSKRALNRAGEAAAQAASLLIYRVP